MGATFNTGYLENLILYNGSNNIGIGTSADATYKVTLGGSLLGTSGVFSSSITATGESFITGSDGGGKMLKFTGGTTKFNWMIAAQQNVNNGLEITPSSAAGGSTFSTPAVVVTSGGNVGIGTSSPNIGGVNRALTLNAATSTNASYELAVNNVLQGSLYTVISTSSLNLYTFVNGPLVFGTNSAERMRITSGGNVGIGTSSPSYTFDVNKSVAGDFIARIYNTSATGYGLFLKNGDNTKPTLRIVSSTDGAVLDVLGNGNVGIGTSSPDVTGFGYTTLTIKGGTTAGYAGVLELQTTQTTSNGQNIGIMAFLDGTSRNAQIGIQRDSSTSTANMMFYTNAGAGIVERMRITSGGSVGIGTTPPTNNGGTSVWIGGTGGINDDGASYYVGMHNAYYNSGWKYLKSSVNAQYYLQDDVGNHIWASAASGTAGNAITFSEKMRITSGGDLVMGSGGQIQTTGGYYRLRTSASATVGLFIQRSTWTGSGDASPSIAAETGYGIPFFTNGTTTPRMEITSGGNVLIGTTTTTGIATGASTNQGISLGSGTISSQVNNNSNQYWSKATGYTSGDFTAHFVNNVYVGGISTNGSSTTYATASDYRLKYDLKSFNGIDLINLIKTYDFAWKTDNSRMYGVIAHELLEVLPYAVTGVKDGEMMQGVDYSKLTPILVKAIQEQQQQIEELKAKLN